MLACSTCPSLQRKSTVNKLKLYGSFGFGFGFGSNSLPNIGSPMLPLPVEQTGESPAAGGGGGGGVETQRSLPTPFLTKTYHLVDDPSVDELISWNDDGSTFVVWRPAEFARDLLPKYFKHNNFSSFVRQLNTYGFRKVVPDRWEFANDCFKKGEKPLLRDIQRRKISHALAAAAVVPAVTAAAVPVPTTAVSPTNSGDDQVISTNVTPAAKVAPGLSRTTSCTIAPETVETLAAELRRTTSWTTAPGILEENERLRKENVQMNQELTELRGLCSNIFALMNNYNSNQVDGSSSNTSNNNNNLPDGRALDLMPAAQVLEAVLAEEMAMSGGPRVGTTLMLGEDETSPRLFGVSIGAKRVRREEEEEEEEEEEDEEMQVSDQVESEENEQQMSDMKSEPLDGSSERPVHDDSRWLELGK